MTDEKHAPHSSPAEYAVPGTEEPPESAEENQKLKWWQIFWGMLRRPGRTYRITQGRAGLLLPVVMVLGGTIFTTLMVSIAQQGEVAAMMREELTGAGMSPVEIESVVGMAASPWVLALGAAGAVVMVLFTWMVYSGILHLAARALGGEGVFRQAFEIVGWAWIALFIGSLVKGGYILVTGNLLLPQGTGLGHAFLTNTDLFTIWNMVLLVLGFAAVYGVHKWKAAVPVVVLWLATVLLTYTTGGLPAQGPGPGM
jgi:hypothetical protein